MTGVFSPHQLWRFAGLLEQALETNRRVFAAETDAGSIAEGLPVARASDLKAWVSVMYGCNNFCSYCIVPYVRGRERSRRPEDVLAEISGLAQSGYRDITLLGQNVNSYGRELEGGGDFSDLLAAAASFPGEYWLRFMHSWQYFGFYPTGSVLLSCLAYVPASAALAWTYEKSGTIWCPIALHAVINALSFTALTLS